MERVSGLRLADTDGLDKDDITAGSFAEEHSLTGFSRDTAQSTFGWRGSNEAVRFTRQILHTCLIPEDRAAGDGRGRVDGKDGNFVALMAEHLAEGLDEGRFAGPRYTGDTDTESLARSGKKSLQYAPRFVEVFRALLSMSVMALDSVTRSPLATPSMYCSTVIFLRSGTFRSGASGYSFAPVMLFAVVSIPRMTEQANSGFFSSGTQLGLKSSLFSGICHTLPFTASPPVDGS